MSDVKIRISILWISLAIIAGAHYGAYIYEPGSIEKVISGELGSSYGLLIRETLLNWLLPIALAVLSISLRSRVNRILNLVAGVGYTIGGIIHIIVCPLLHISDNPAVYQLLLCISQIVVTILIIWQAWKLRD